MEEDVRLVDVIQRVDVVGPLARFVDDKGPVSEWAKEIENVVRHETRPPCGLLAYLDEECRFAVATLLGMERLTISSTVPKLHEVPELSSTMTNALVAANLESPFRVAKLSANEIARATGLNLDEAAHASDVIRLTLLRGIGASHAEHLLRNGISSVCELSRADALATWNRFHPRGQVRPTRAEVRVWVRSAERRCIP